MNDFLKEQLGFLIAIIGGLIVSIITSAKHSFWVATARLTTGLFCSIIMTDPFLNWFSLDSDIYRNSVAGLFAMTGYALTRVISNVDKETLFEIIKIIRGGK